MAVEQEVLPEGARISCSSRCPLSVPSLLIPETAGLRGRRGFLTKEPVEDGGEQMSGFLPGLLNAAFSLISQLCGLTPGRDSGG